MLVLTRSCGESIVIGNDIRVTFLEIRGEGKIRLGIEAPSDVAILREELLYQDRDAETGDTK